LYQCLAA